MHAPAESIIGRTNRAIVRRQIDYARALATPWGISESAYNARDLQLTYQYSNFGIPGLGLKRGLSEDAVIAPYATALAAIVDPVAAARNFTRLGGERRARPLRIFRGARLHAAPIVGWAEGRDRPRVHGPPSGDDHRRHRRRPARRDDARAIPCRADRARGGAAAARAHAPRDRRCAVMGERYEAPQQDPRARDDGRLADRPTRMPRLLPRISSPTAATASC